MHRAISIVMPVLGAILLVAAPARAQKGPFSLVSRQTVPISVDPGATATMVMLVSNHSDADAEATPTITLPTGWQVVTGSASFSLKAGETDALVISVGIPGGSPAGSYPIVIGSGGLAGATAWQTEPESVFVVVREHRSIGLVLLDKPPYAVAGENYEARLRVINRGNSTADVRMAARSSLGAARISPTTRLEPGASKEVVVSVALRDVAGNTADEVLAVTALHAADSSAKGDAAARIAIVPRVGRLDGFSTVSTMLRLRAAPANGGVAPFDITGGGRLSASGSSEISFSATGRSRGISRFGDRESYRLELRSTGYRARVGDHLYTLSSLTGSGQPGVGAAVEASAGLFGAGAYGQRFRSSPALGTESGAFVSVQSSAAPRARMTLNLVNRSRGPFEGRVASSEISLRPTSATLLDAEYAATGADASAYNTRFSGRLGFATLDMGHHRADTGFKGPQRGSSHDYLDLQAPVTERIRVAAFASRNSTRLTGTDSARSNAFANTGVSATLDNRFTVELSSLERSIGLVSDRQRALRLHSDVSFGRLSVTADGRLGISRDSATQASSLLRQFSVAPRLRLGRHSLAAHIGLSDVPNGPARNEAVTTLGLDASTRVGRTTEIGISGFGSHVASTGWIAQGDLRLSQQLSSAITVSARAHLATRPPGASASADRNTFYLEVGLPMRVPVFPRTGAGRVFGRVSDATTGRPVANALVRVGSRLGVTNRDGRIALRDVAPGEYRVTLGEDTTLAASVLSGSTTVRIDSAKRSPVRFDVAVSRGAGVNSDIRRMAMARTAVDSTAPDSLVDAGPMQNMLVVLTSRRDTLYQTTDAKGKVSFTDVPPGAWVVTIVAADLPMHHAFDRQSYELSLEPGQVVSTEFRLVPRRRAVQMVTNGSTESISRADPAATAAQR